MKRTLMAVAFMTATYPTLVFADFLDNAAQTNIVDIVDAIGTAIRIFIPAAIALLVIAFFYGLSKYVFSAGDPEKAAEGKSMMIYGALAMFVGLSIWGVVGYLQAFFHAEVGGVAQDIYIPEVHYGGSGG